MRVAHINAPFHAYNFSWRPVQMAIAPWIKSDLNYQAYFNNTAFDYVIMDNGIFEGEQPTHSDLHQLSRIAHADVIVLPDVHGDGEATLYRSKEMLDYLLCEAMYEGTVMFVPQGIPQSAWQRCLNSFLTWVPRSVDLVLGLAEACPHQVPASKRPDLYPRHEVLHRLLDEPYPIHILGMPNLQRFVQFELPYADRISSVDTSIAYALGMSGLVITPTVEKIQMFPVDKWKNVLISPLRHLVEHNRDMLDVWAKEGSV